MGEERFTDQSANKKMPRGNQIFDKEYGHFIGGTWRSSQGGSADMQSSINPTNGEVISWFQSGTVEDVNDAVEAARSAFPSWRNSAPAERQELLREFAKRLRARSSEFALMEAVDKGEPVSQAEMIDLPIAIEQFDLFSAAAWSPSGHTAEREQSVSIVLREPMGVCAQIIPWNVPLVMMAAKIAPALAAGNTVVLKPAEPACLSVLEFIKEVEDLVPPGVLNVVTGSGNVVGEALVKHPGVSKVAFTGSTETGRKIIKYASVNVIPQTMELGGKSASIICEDADIDAAAEATVMSTVLNKGEICLASSRALVHEAVYDEFVETVCRKIRQLSIGDPTSPQTQHGPQVSKVQYDKILRYLNIALDEGGRFAVGGEAAKVEGLENGFFVQPSIITGLTNEARVAQEEIFGPVTCVMKFSDENEALTLANASRYGLAAGIWTRDLRRAHRLSLGVEAGTVWVNRYYNFIGGMPIGGFKHSGFGREFAYETLGAYSKSKAVTINLLEGSLGLFGG